MARASGKLVEPADVETVARAIRAQRAAALETFLARIEPTLATLVRRVDAGAPLTADDARAVRFFAKQAAELLPREGT